MHIKIPTDRLNDRQTNTNHERFTKNILLNSTGDRF